MATPKLTKREHFALEIYKSIEGDCTDFQFKSNSKASVAVDQADKLILALKKDEDINNPK